ncbi:uncharacterized protein LOC134307776 isoform X2 [Trichomycterus rosablanca]|uniref:uncharacterized protein LOC134307776 isoform X2 n=1 Tax=Trichomycterus rosablanca TaxID=2290929 RepID=UPI002F360ACC
MLESAVASSSHQQQQMSLEGPLVPDFLSATNPCSTPPDDSFSVSSVPLSSFPNASPVSIATSSPNNFSSPVISSSALQPPARPYSPISPPPPFLYSSVSPSVPLPCPIPRTPAESSRPITPPSSESEPPPVYEPISPIPASAHQDSPIIGLFCSSTPLAAVKSNYHMESKEALDVSMLKEERKTVDTVPPPHTFSLPRLPPVMGQSHACVFLNVRGILNTEPIIGLSNIVECRRISQRTFFLCLNCAETISREGICDHMTSEQHLYLSVRHQYPKIFQDWKVQTDKKTIRDVAWEVASREKLLDARVIKLDQMQYQSLRSANFQDAIEILQRMYGPEQNENSPSTHITDHDPTNRDVDGLQGDQSRTVINSPTREQLQQSLRSPKAFPESSVQTKHSQHESTLQMGLTAKSDCKNAGRQSSEPHIERTRESPLITEQPGLQQGAPAHSLSNTITIKQEKPDNYEVVVLTPTVETPSPIGAAGNSSKHTTDLMEFVNIRTDAADAVVGLSSVIECRSEGQVPLYLCVSCSSKLNHDLIISHLLKCGHRYSYLKARYPSMIEDWSDSDSRSQRSTKLMWLAHKVKTSSCDEPGQLQKMNLNCVDFKTIKSLPFEKAIMQLQKIRMLQKLSPLQTNIVPKITPVLVKQERMEMEVTAQDLPHLVDSSECNSKKPKKAAKRRVVEQDSSHQSSMNKSLSHLKDLKQNNPNLFEYPVKRKKSSEDPSTPSTLPETSPSSLGGLAPDFQTYLQKPEKSAKCSEVHQGLSHQASREKSSDNPSCHLKHSSSIDNSLDLSKSPREKIFNRSSDHFSQLHKEPFMTPVHSDRSLPSCGTSTVPEISPTTSGGSQNHTKAQKDCSENES